MRNCILVGLIILNCILVVMVLDRVFQTPEAQAQPIGLSGNFLMTNGSGIGLVGNVVYLVDLQTRQLRALHFDQRRGEANLIGTRDLARDLAPPPPPQQGNRRTR